MEILIIRLSSMGDVVLATSVFEHLKSSIPIANLWFATDSKYAGLFAGDTRLAGVVPVDRGNEGVARRLLAKTAWTRILDLQNNRRSVRVRRGLVSSEKTTVFRKRHLERAVLLLLRANLYPKGDSVVARYARACGAPDGIPAPRLILDKKKCGTAPGFLPESGMERPSIALFPFSAWKNKEWPAEFFTFVGRYFAVKGWNVLVAGGPSDIAAADRMKNAVGERCVSTAGKLSLGETACLISQCNLALGNDTGLSHMARACGVKTGIIFGPTTRHFGFFPVGNPPFRVFEAAQFCRPCQAHGGNVCYLGTRMCLRKIRPEAVVAGLEELYQRS